MKRYEAYCILWNGTCDAEVRENDNGEFVYYEEVEAELSRLRAVNAELRKILARALAEEKCGADGVFFTVATECTEGRCWHFQARAALSRAEQAKPEVKR